MDLLRAKDYIYQENIIIPVEPTPSTIGRISLKTKPKRCKFCGALFRGLGCCCSPECTKKQTAKKRVEYNESKKRIILTKICPVCLQTFRTDLYHNRETCNDECHHALGSRSRQPKIETCVSGCVAVEIEAQKMGLHYSDIQKQHTLDMVGKIDVTLGGIL